MNTIEILVTCLALSLDCFVVMMARGAMMNPQEHRRSLINSLIFAGSSLLMIVLGSLAGSLIKSQLVLHVNQVIAALILFALGCFVDGVFEDGTCVACLWKSYVLRGMDMAERNIIECLKQISYNEVAPTHC